MIAYQGAVGDATYAAFGIDAVYTQPWGRPGCRFGDARIRAEAAIFELEASALASPRRGE